MSVITAEKNTFLKTTPENENFNQYWYSEATLSAMVNEIVEQECTSVACIACPSLFFTLKQQQPDLFAKSVLLDIDTQWNKEQGYIEYDYRKPLQLSPNYQHSFDCVVIDPPFITRDAWELFAEAGNLLLKDGGLMLCSSIAENESMLNELVHVHSVQFKPSIPHLIYQV